MLPPRSVVSGTGARSAVIRVRVMAQLRGSRLQSSSQNQEISPPTNLKIVVGPEVTKVPSSR